MTKMQKRRLTKLTHQEAIRKMEQRKNIKREIFRVVDDFVQECQRREEYNRRLANLRWQIFANAY